MRLRPRDKMALALLNRSRLDAPIRLAASEARLDITFGTGTGELPRARGHVSA